MENIAEKLSELLSSDGGIEKIKSLAENLLGDNAPQTENGDKDSENDNGFSLPEGFDIGKIMGLASAFGNQKPDHRSALLLALKPHLGEARRERVDKAVKLLKIAAMLPLLKEQGILDIF